MKRLLVLIFVLFSVSLYAQKIEFMNEVTVANSAIKTFYVPINNKESARLDSIQIAFTATGEIDLDRLICTKGGVNASIGANSSRFTAVATPDTTTLSVDNAAGVTTYVSYKAATIALTALAQYDMVKISFEAAASGCDATDPNKLYVRIIPYYTYLK